MAGDFPDTLKEGLEKKGIGADVFSFTSEKDITRYLINHPVHKFSKEDVRFPKLPKKVIPFGEDDEIVTNPIAEFNEMFKASQIFEQESKVQDKREATVFDSARSSSQPPLATPERSPIVPIDQTGKLPSTSTPPSKKKPFATSSPATKNIYQGESNPYAYNMRQRPMKMPDENHESLSAQTYTAGSETSPRYGQPHSFNATGALPSNAGPMQAPSPYQTGSFTNSRAESSARPQKLAPNAYSLAAGPTPVTSQYRPGKRPSIPVPSMFRRSK